VGGDSGGVWVALLVQGSLHLGQYRLVGPFATEEACSRWCDRFNRAEELHGGVTHAMPEQTWPHTDSFKDWYDPIEDADRLGGRTHDEVLEYAISLYDPEGSVVIFASFDGGEDEGEFTIHGPMKPENVDEVYRTIPGGLTLREQERARELTPPDEIFRLLTIAQ
jgi:hypothetical protein